MVDSIAIAGSRSERALAKPGLAEALVRARYKYIPDHVVGEILTKRWIDNVAPFTFLIITVALFGYLIPDFFSPGSLIVSLRQLGEFGFVVIAMMIVMVAGGIDLSVGSNFALGNFTGWPP
jgi:ribose transport system permease protein